MKNWNIDLKKLKKNPAKYRLWKTEQLINFGLDKEKLDASYVKTHFTQLNVDPAKRTFLSFLLWPQKKSSRKHKKHS